MNFIDTLNSVDLVLSTGEVPLVVGESGIGKTALARKLAKMKVKDAAPQLGIEPESLKRIEAPSSEIGPSLEVLCGAIELYGQNPNFYWVDWEENQKLLKDEKEEN